MWSVARLNIWLVSDKSNWLVCAAKQQLKYEGLASVSVSRLQKSTTNWTRAQPYLPASCPGSRQQAAGSSTGIISLQFLHWPAHKRSQNRTEKRTFIWLKYFISINEKMCVGAQEGEGSGQSSLESSLVSSGSTTVFSDTLVCSWKHLGLFFTHCVNSFPQGGAATMRAAKTSHVSGWWVGPPPPVPSSLPPAPKTP